MLPEPVKNFVDSFAKLPGIGPRQATRLAFHVVNQGKAMIAELSQAVLSLDKLKTCPTCFATTPASAFAKAAADKSAEASADAKALADKPADKSAEASADAKALADKPAGKPNAEVCGICANPQRTRSVIAIVEKETDLVSLEKTKKFNGRYLILGDLKKDGVLNQIQKLRLQTIKNAEEIILAINPTTYGDINATLIAQELKNSLPAGGQAPKITRLGRGIPTGGEIEFADEETLGGALDNRS